MRASKTKREQPIRDTDALTDRDIEEGFQYYLKVRKGLIKGHQLDVDFEDFGPEVKEEMILTANNVHYPSKETT